MTAVPRLERDLLSLIKLKNSKHLRKILMRVRYRATACSTLEDAIQSVIGTGLLNKGRLVFK